MRERKSLKLSSSAKTKSRIKSELSPRKSISSHKVVHEDKLKVYIKLKPHQSQNLQNIQYVNDKEIQIERQLNNKIYRFDHVFHHQTSNTEAFSIGCQSLLDQILNSGGNGLIFVYGHTGTGKTHTMGLLSELNEKSQGIVPSSLKYIFQRQISHLSISFSEIYLDEVYDMLDFQVDRKLTIRQEKSTKQPYLQNQINISVKSIKEAFQLINIGLERRKMAEQKINKRSSRGHGIITLNILYNGKHGKLCFVDLAGSQRIKESESKGKNLNEAVHINTSLSALETLLMNISDQSVRMYRGNKLTRLLQPFMESGKVRLFVTSNYQNIQPIEFAKRCKGIKFKEKQPATKKNKQLKENLKEDDNAKQMLYYISNMLGIICKISQNLGELLQDLSIKTNFSLAESFQIKNSFLQNEINNKIHKFQSMEEKILNPQPNHDFSPQQILTSLSSPDHFINKVHQMGFSIFHSLKQIFNLADYRNILKKQVFTSQLKASLLQNKNKQLETAVNHLIQSHPPQNQSKLAKQLKQLGVEILVNKKKKEVKDGKKYQKMKTPSQSKSRQDIQNSPMNRSHRKSLIYIEEL